MPSINAIRKKYRKIKHCLNEKTRRLWCATEAMAIEKKGVAIVHAATKVSIPTIYVGIKELRKKHRRKKTNDRIRKKGGGAKLIAKKSPGIMQALEILVESATKGDPMKPLQWTSKSLQKLSGELTNQGFKASPNTVASLLRKMGYSLQLNRKEKEGK